MSGTVVCWLILAAHLLPVTSSLLPPAAYSNVTSVGDAHDLTVDGVNYHVVGNEMLEPACTNLLFDYDLTTWCVPDQSKYDVTGGDIVYTGSTSTVMDGVAQAGSYIEVQLPTDTVVGGFSLTIGTNDPSDSYVNTQTSVDDVAPTYIRPQAASGAFFLFSPPPMVSISPLSFYFYLFCGAVRFERRDVVFHTMTDFYF